VHAVEDVLFIVDADDLTGNDDLDYSLWLAGSSIFGALSMLDTNIGIVLPGDSVLTGLETEDLVFFGHAGAHFALNPTFTLKFSLVSRFSTSSLFL